MNIDQTNRLIWIFDMKYGYRPSEKGASDLGSCTVPNKTGQPTPSTSIHHATSL